MLLSLPSVAFQARPALGQARGSIGSFRPESIRRTPGRAHLARCGDWSARIPVVRGATPQPILVLPHCFRFERHLRSGRFGYHDWSNTQSGRRCCPQDRRGSQSAARALPVPRRWMCAI